MAYPATDPTTRPIAADAAAGPGPVEQLVGATAQIEATLRDIDRACDTENLRTAAFACQPVLDRLDQADVGIAARCAVQREFDDRVCARLWALLAPAALQRDCCLVVMGSEGRGERVARTDQDNALLLRDDCACDGVDEFATAFTDELVACGFPACPGGIMLSRPAWRRSVADFRETLRSWFYDADPEGPLQLSIFLDARAIAGDASLLTAVREHLWRIMPDDDAFLLRFTAAIEQFEAHDSWWHRLSVRHGLHEAPLDLKKSALFPIVHGARALALKHHVDAVSTAGRLHMLRDQGHLGSAQAGDLVNALHFLLHLKARNDWERRRETRPSDNQIEAASLGTLDRQRLAGALAVVKGLRETLHLQGLLGSV